MYKPLGYSVYLSTFALQRPALERRSGTGALVFLSLHIGEEFGPDYCKEVQSVCLWLAEAGFRTVADVSVKTVEQFGEPDLVRLARRLRLWALRIDYGFSVQEIAALAQQLPIVLNASTTTPEDGAQIAASGTQVMALHNFYPRPETGLDPEFLLKSTRSLQQAGLEVLGFIPGDETLRGPVYAGLPTLERHRGLPPSVCFAELMVQFQLDGVFVADPGLCLEEQDRIGRFCESGVLSIPADLVSGREALYGQVFTNRADSPAWMVRFAESRVYSCFGAKAAPENCGPRIRGSITLDNERYGRYSGEIQLLREDFPADERVNVIGQVKASHLPLIDCIPHSSRFVLVP